MPTMTPITIEAMELMPKPKKRPRTVPHCMITKHVFVEMPTGDLLRWMVVEPFTIEAVYLRMRASLYGANDWCLRFQMIVPSRTL